ncbi:hypothetical protein YYC_02941 [Plasmodium yoelii 17X]|uniref:Uncharacterized protein n=4 Tax=Plasmodium yoelii TaxID=5861 RepID=Q7RPS8_PLAYO|nr:WD repeat-containing protein, putative [Plasmodium yoelii]EAA20694.1 hypothetical protein [Plasmodium yoelii yoelii]ETB59461.1 hypothetical protein YYC_02941 [Plasmodium yoelii 17X]CDU85189.1 conserved Plasmodium protein, unknown function [Plasmodium yoelii]VTZ79084.1 WD repeat-containing protein, putative [Plasmodium yoelii]|eukprot:XP_729129.1 WD repeat-containing protein, putative [Plasmodium yoelii]
MLNKKKMKKRQRPKDFNSLDCSKKIENISEEEKKYIYPSIPNSPIIFHNDNIIYGLGKSLIIFNIKENKYIKKIEEHESVIRSLDVNENSKYFLTTGDDKIIIIYDENWNVRYKIVHKKKIVKAYFLKCGDEKIEKNEILFIDKYGDVYLCNTQLLLKDGGLKDNNLSESNTNNDQNCKKENNDTSSEGSITIKLNYLIDSLNDIEIKDEDLFFMKDFEHILENNYDNSDGSYNIENEIDMKENKNSEEKLDEQNDNNKINIFNGHENKINKIKEKLEKHYEECFNNHHYLHPIITCSSGVVSLYYDNNFLIIGDRDEKIRILKNKDLNKIYNFYLNHKLFITSLALINEKIFCSSGADSYLYLWNIKTKEIIDSLYIDYNFLSKYIELKLFFNNSNNIDKYNFIVGMLIFNKKTSSIYMSIENIKGILVIPLNISSTDKEHVKINKDKIKFYLLKDYPLSFLFTNNNDNNNNSLFYVGRSNGNLNQIIVNEENEFNSDPTVFPHSFFTEGEQIDIGLINHWKHTVEDNF